MSKVVDNRIVEMQFDNKHFESNVRESMSTLDKLKKSLNLKGASKGLESIDSAAKKVDMSGLKNGIESVTLKLSNLQVIGVTALANITNSAVNAGKRIVSALTIEPVKTGFQEYETQINAIQTILANTQKEGTNVEQVNAALDELNEYADLTIYNFTEMTRNIGTFTAAGVKLDTSVQAIKGIANLAAVSGSTSQQASTAMYQLSQALAAGKVQLMDWNSVVNAGMGGQVFQDALIRTSEMLGTGAKAAIEAEGSFRESLTKSGWLTTEVLTETLNQLANAYDKTELMAQGFTESQADEIVQLAQTAEDAATKIKTFTQLWDVLKEAAQSGWSQTWRIIIGDFDQAKNLFTPLGEFFTGENGIITIVSNARNALLESALGQGFTNLIDQFNDAMSTVQNVSDSILDLGAVVDEVILGNFGNGQERFDALTEAGYNWCLVQNQVNETLGNSYRYTQEQIDAQNELLGLNSQTEGSVSSLADAQKEYIKELAKLSDEQLRSQGYTEEQIAAFQELRNAAEKIGMPLDDFIDQIDEINGRWLLLDSFKNVGQAIITVFQSISNAFQEIFEPIKPEQLFDAVAALHKFSASLILNEEDAAKLQRTFKGLFSIIDIFTSVIGGGFKLASKLVSSALNAFDMDILDLTASMGDAISEFHDFIFENEIINAAFDKLGEAIKFVVENVKNFIDTFVSLPEVSNAIDGIKEAISGFRDFIIENEVIDKAFNKLGEAINFIVENVKNFIDTFLSIPEVSNVIDGIKEAISGFRDFVFENDVIDKAFNKLGETIKFVVDNVKNFVDMFLSIPEVSNVIDGIKDSFSKLGEIGPNIIEGLKNGIQDGLKSIPGILIEIGQRIIESIKGVLGIHSPSTVMFEIGQNIIQGLYNGIYSAVSGLWDFIKGIGKNIADIFSNIGLDKIYDNVKNGVSSTLTFIFNLISSIGQGIADALNAVDWGVVVTAITSAGVFITFYKLIKVFESFTAVLGNFSKPFAKMGSVLDAFAGKIKAETLGVKADALKTLAVAIGIVVASIWVLTTLDPGAVWNAVAVIAVVSAVLVGLTFALSKIGGTEGIKDNVKSLTNLTKLSGLIVSIGLALIMLSATMKIISGMSWEDIGKAVVGVTAFGAVVIALVAITKYAGNENQLAKTASIIEKIGFAFLILTVVAKIISGMSWEELGKAGAGMGGLVVIVAGLMAATKLIGNGKSIKNIGKTIFQVAAAIAVLAIVAKVIAGMSWEDLDKGVEGITMFSAIIIALMAATRLIGGNKGVKNVGKTILQVAAAIGILAIVAKMIAKMSWDDLNKGVFGISALGLIVVALMAATRVAGGRDLNGVAKTLLAMSASIAILAGICVLLGLVKTETLIKGIAAVGALSVMVALMVAATRNAKDVKGTMIGISIAIGIMAAALVVLSFIDPSKLFPAVAALSIVMGMFALVEKASGSVTKSFGTIIVLAAVIGIIAGVLLLIQNLPVETTLTNALALSIVLLALAESCEILDGVKKVSTSAMVAIGVLTLVVGGIAVIFGLLSYFDIAPSLETAASLSIVLLAMSAVVGILGLIAPVAQAAVGGALAMVEVVGVLSLAILAFGAISQIPGVDWLVEEGGEFLQKIGEAIGQFVGGIAGGILEGATSTLPEVANNLSEFMNNLTPFLDGAQNINPTVLEGVKSLAEVILVLTAAGILDGIATFLNFGKDPITEFATQLGALGEGVKDFVNAMAGVNPEDAQAKAEAVKHLCEAVSQIPSQGGLWDMIAGKKDAGEFGTQLAALGEGVAKFMNSMSAIDPEDTQTKAEAVSYLCEAASKIPTTGGLWGLIAGDNKAGEFGDQLAVLGEGVAKFMNAMTGVNPEDTQIKAEAVKNLCESAKQIPTTGGLWDMIAGGQDAGRFGDQLAVLGEGVAKFMASTEGISSGAIENSKAAIDSLVDISDAIPPDTDIFTKIANFFTGGDSDTSFVDKLVPLGKSLKSYSDEVTGIDSGSISLSSSAVDSIKEIGTKISDSDINVEESDVAFAEKLAPLGRGMKVYSAQVSGINSVSIIESSNAAEHIVSLVKSTAGIDTSGVTSFVNAVNTLGNAQFSKFANSFGEGAKQMAQNGTDIMDAFAAGIKSKSSTLSNLAQNIINSMTRVISSKVSEFNTAGQQMINSLASGFGSGNGRALAAVVSVLSSSVNSVNAYRNRFYNAGAYIADGLAYGIRSKSQSVREAAENLAEIAETVTRSTLKINSPSKVFMEIGQGIPEGLAKGIDKFGYFVNKSIGSMTTNALDNTKSAISSIGDVINSDIDSQPTIRPVIDMSNVNSSVSSINDLFSRNFAINTSLNASAANVAMNRSSQKAVTNKDVVNAINSLSTDIRSIKAGNSTHIGNITYDDNSSIQGAVSQLVDAIVVGGRM